MQEGSQNSQQLSLESFPEPSRNANPYFLRLFFFTSVITSLWWGCSVSNQYAKYKANIKLRCADLEEDLKEKNILGGLDNRYGDLISFASNNWACLLIFRMTVC